MWTMEQVKAIRQRLKLSQADFANLLGVDVRTVARWESTSGPRPAGPAEAVLNGLNEKLSKDPNEADDVLRFLVSAAAVGGLAYLIVKLLDAATKHE